MAIIKCPECGHDVSDKAKTCPNCGVDILGNIYQCPRCYNVFLAETNVCPDCGTTIGKKIPSSNNVNKDVKKNPRRQNDRNSGGAKIQILAFLIALVLVCAGVYYFWETRNTAETEAYDNAMMTKSPAILHEYLDRFGDSNSEHRDSVMAVLNAFAAADSAWCIAQAEATRNAYAVFLENYPESEYAIEARLFIDSVDWKAATEKNDAASYKFYIDNNPSGLNLDEAKAKFEKLDAKMISKSDSIMVIKLFEDYYKALSEKDEAKLKTLFTMPIKTFLSKENARVSDVVAYMNRLHAPKDVKSISFSLVGDWEIVKKPVAKGKPRFEIGFTVDYNIDRSNVNKKSFHSYKVNATVSSNGRISGLDMSLTSV